jgi:hypothetical protein
MSALGLAYGTLIGGLYAAAGTVAAGLLAYGLSRWLGRPLALRLAGEEALASGEKTFAAGWRLAGRRIAPRAHPARGDRLPRGTEPDAVPHFLPRAALRRRADQFPLRRDRRALAETSPAWALALSVVVPVLLWLLARRWLRR